MWFTAYTMRNINVHGKKGYKVDVIFIKKHFFKALSSLWAIRRSYKAKDLVSAFMKPTVSYCAEENPLFGEHAMREERC